MSDAQKICNQDLGTGTVTAGARIHDLGAQTAGATLYAWAYHNSSTTAVFKEVTLNGAGKVPATPRDIEWDLAGGTAGAGATAGTASAEPGETITAPSVNPTKTGFKFSGWKVSDTVTITAAGGTAKMPDGTGKLTITAQWTQVYALTYNINGGTGTAPTGGSYAAGEKVTLAAGTGLSKTGYTFGGWSVSGNAPAITGQYTMPAAATELKAVWTAIPVNFANNNKDVSQGGKINTAFTLTLPAAKDGSGSGYKYELTGDLPAGLNQTGGPNSAITISGTPTAEVTKTLTYKVTDTNGTNKTIEVKITISDKDPITLTADNVKFTYGDTAEHKVVGTVTTAGYTGKITYAVKSGDAITIDPNTGVITAPKAGTATVTVTAAEAGNFGSATKDVTVTVDKKSLSVTIPALKEGDAFPETAEFTGKVGADDVSVKLAWTTADGTPVDPDAKVEKNAEYTWTVSLDGTAKENYTSDKDTGTLKLNEAGSGIVIGGSKQTYTVTYNVGSHGNFSSDASTT
ncbi:MAG: cadherin repeat domain-containing protein, partial [Oscillospiraceae bacterium]|nr:cadherin repeat domain-containing protein [Oscillospiraceae bacterium]